MGWFALIPAAISAVGSLKDGQDQESAGKYNAEVASLTSHEQARRDEIQARMVIGQDRASYGASGVTLEGSPLDVLQQSAKMAELDRLTTIYAGETQSAAYSASASAAKTKSALSASGTLVGAFAGYKANSAKSSLAPTNNGGSDGTLLDAGTTLKRVG